MKKTVRIFLALLTALAILAFVFPVAAQNYPVVNAENGGFNPIQQTTHTVYLPEGITSGDLLLVFFGAKTDTSISFPGGWTPLFNEQQAGQVRFGCWYKIADGTESSTIIATTGTAVRTAHISYRISNYSGLPQASAAKGFHNAGIPPSLSPVWGEKMTLWIAATCYNEGFREILAYPTGYLNGLNQRGLSGGESVGVATAWRILTAANEDPGTFVLDNVVSIDWVAATVAICPPGSPPTVTTQAATNVEVSTATLSGSILAVNDTAITHVGFVYDTVSRGEPGDVAPGQSGYFYTDDVAEGDPGMTPLTYYMGMYELSGGTTYYYRACARNAAGFWAYGPEVLFQTKPGVPPAAPTAVSATAGTHNDKVVITWSKSPGATGYQVYRDGIGLGWLDDVATFSDFDAGAPTITPGTASASKGTSPAHVALTLSGAAANPGSTHSYTVIARNDFGESAFSSADPGYRGTASLNYQWQRSAANMNSDYSNIKGATTVSYNDSGAPAPTVTAGTASASKGTSPDHVTLTVTGSSASDGAGRYYRCVVSMSGAATQNSSAAQGHRGVGPLTYQWYRSSSDDINSSYSSIKGATTNPYNDTGAPADGSGRYYACLVSAAGAESRPTNSDRGFRDATVGVSVATDAATGIIENAAKLNMNFTLGGYSSVDVRFAYKKPGDDKWVNTAWTRQTRDGTYSVTLTGLDSGTDYEFKAQLQYGSYEIEGDILGFSTPGVPPAAPTAVSATAGNHTDKVVITWSKSPGATGYQVYRDGIALGWLDDVAAFSDLEADAPTITPGTASASKGTSPAYIALTLSGAAANPGSTHIYTIKARNDFGESTFSSADPGYRGTSRLYYQWQRSSGDSDSGYSDIKVATDPTFNDTAAPAPTVTAGTASASKGTSPDHVTLTVTGYSASDGAGRYYRCVVSMSGAADQNSSAAQGHRGAGPLTYQWYRSSRDDSNSTYSSIRDATTNPYNDTVAPTDGSGRYYACLVSAAGAESRPTNSDRGFREASGEKASLTVKLEGQGTTMPVVGSHTYDEGTRLNLTAEPAADWVFEKWVVNGTEHTTPEITITMDSDKIAVAVFLPTGTGSINHVVLEIGEDMVVCTIGAYGSALAAGAGNEMYDFMAADGVLMVRAVGSGDKYIGIGAYGTAFAQEGNTAGAIAAASAQSWETVSAYLVFDGFDGDGQPILTPLYP